jgi:hypothetical protein
VSPSTVLPTPSKSVSMFIFPTDDKIHQLWLKNIRREVIENGKRIPFKPTSSHRVCSLHFDDNDFVTVSEDTHSTRKALKPILHVKRLKANAVPHIFTDFPAYFHSTPSTSSKPESRCKYNKF